MSYEADTSPKVGNIIIPISRRRKLEKKVVEHVLHAVELAMTPADPMNE